MNAYQKLCQIEKLSKELRGISTMMKLSRGQGQMPVFTQLKKANAGPNDSPDPEMYAVCSLDSEWLQYIMTARSEEIIRELEGLGLSSAEFGGMI